jgi:hypothetical protein
MKVFISSLIAGMQNVRRAARDAVTTLRHEAVMAEDFGAQPASPQVACLTGLRQSDLVVLVLGERYGAEQPSGLSATHEEYREAQGSKPVLAFVQEGVTFEPRQAAFVEEVQGWSGGLFRGGFTVPADLQVAITRALHDYELAKAVGPVDEAALVQRAVDLLPAQERGHYSAPMLSLAIAGGPTQKILRPVQLEDEALWDRLHQSALFGRTRVFDQAKGATKEIQGAALVISQDRDGAWVRLDEQGAIVVRSPIERSGGGRGDLGGLPVVIEEAVQRNLATALAYASGVLEQIDPSQRLTHVAVGAQITGGEHSTWRTQREHDASPNSMSMGMGEKVRAPVHVSRMRAALRLDAEHLVEDLLVPLRRQWKS